MALINSRADVDPSVSRRNRHKALLHREATDLADWANRLIHRLHLGPLVTDELMELLTCDAAVQLVVTEFGSPVRLGRSTSTIPAWLRHLVMHRDNGCRLCGATVGLDAHHLIHWSKGGLTDPSNLVTLCARHHSLLHKGEFDITGNPEQVPGPTTDDGLVFRNHHGLRIRPPTPRRSSPTTQRDLSSPHRRTARQAQRHFQPNQRQRIHPKRASSGSLNSFLDQRGHGHR